LGLLTAEGPLLSGAGKFVNTQESSDVRHTVVLIPGDGIGPEVTRAVLRVVDATGVGIRWQEHVAGLAALAAGKDVLPEETIQAIRDQGVALKGPCTTPVGEGFSSVNVQLRKSLDLYAAVRPVRNLLGVEARYSDVDLVVVRENTEGLYSGIENEITAGVVTSLKVATEKGSVRIARWAFDYARKTGLGKVTVFHKANIMKLTDGLFVRSSRRIHEQDYPDIEFEEVIIDAGCMRIVQDPSQFKVLLLQNLYGDVVSDLCAGLVGGLGVVPGANIGDEHAVFEAVHGSAPDIAGKGIANPMALLMSAVMLLNYLAKKRGDPVCHQAAVRVRTAYDKALADGHKTRDLRGELGTEEFADAVIARL